MDLGNGESSQSQCWGSKIKNNVCVPALLLAGMICFISICSVFPNLYMSTCWNLSQFWFRLFLSLFIFFFFLSENFFLEQNILESRDSQFPESCVASLKYNNYIDPQEPAGSYFRRALRMIWEQWRRKGFARVKRKKVGERGFNSNIHQWRIKLDWCKISKCNFTTWPRFPKINLDTFCEHTSRRNILSNLVLCTALLFPPSLLALPDEARQIKRTKSNHENNNKLSNLFSATRESNHQTRLQKKRFKKPVKEQNRYQLEQADAPRAATTRPLTIISEFQQA